MKGRFSYIRYVRYVPALLFSATVALGLVGWSQIYHNEGDVAWTEVIYHTLLAFVGDDSYILWKSEHPESAKCVLSIARFVGLAFTVSAILTVAAAAIREYSDRLLARRMKSHNVMIGASRFAINYHSIERALVVYDTATALEAIPIRASVHRQYRIPHQMGLKVGTGKELGKMPKTVIFGDYDSVTNVERARHWVSQNENTLSNPRTAPQLVLRIEDNSVARDFGLLTDKLAKATLISLAEITARGLVTAIAPTELCKLRNQKQVHVVLVGLGNVNLALAEELVLRCHRPGQLPPFLTIIDQDADRARARTRAERPDLFNPEFGRDGDNIEFHAMDAMECCAIQQRQELADLENKRPITAIVVSAGNDTSNLGIAMRLRKLQKEAQLLRAPIFMRSDSLGSISPPPFDDLTAGIVPFGGQKLTPEDLKIERIHQKLAEELHQVWRNSPDVIKTPENDWPNLPTADKRSSYRAALSAVELLYAAGFVPPNGDSVAGLRALGAAVRTTLEGEDKDKLLELAKNEHMRWMSERRLDGYQFPANGERDNEKKLHNLLIPYEELPEENKKKDHKVVTTILENCVLRSAVAPDLPVWRKVIRVGVLGPIRADEKDVAEQVEEGFKKLGVRYPDLDQRSLEILTPNAPGFDRIATQKLAQAWMKKTGRPCSILLMNAATLSTLDEKAEARLKEKNAAHSKSENSGTLISPVEQSRRLQDLADKEDVKVRTMDLRKLGQSDKDLLKDQESYNASIAAVQTHLMDLADEVFFATQGRSAGWTTEAADGWTKTDAIKVS